MNTEGKVHGFLVLTISSRMVMSIPVHPHVCMFVCACVPVSVCMHVCMCVHACVCVCMYTCASVSSEQILKVASTAVG